MAYILPGLMGIYGLSMVWPPVEFLLQPEAVGDTSLGGFLHLAVASVGVGLTFSTLRWLLLDRLHHATGLAPPRWELSQLGSRVQAFELLIQIHYRYYQFYGNSLVAMTFTYVAWRAVHFHQTCLVGWPDALYASLAALFFAGSRDSLRKYYERVAKLLADERIRRLEVAARDDD